MVWVVHSPIVYVIKWHPWIDRVCWNALDVSELVHNPLRSVSDNNRPPAELSWETWNRMKVLDRSVFRIWHPTDIWNPETIQALPVHRCRYLFDSLLCGNPLTRMWWHLVVLRISIVLRNWRKLFICPTLQSLHENYTNFKMNIWNKILSLKHFCN